MGHPKTGFLQQIQGGPQIHAETNLLEVFLGYRESLWLAGRS